MFFIYGVSFCVESMGSYMFRFHETNSQSTEKNDGLEDEFLFGVSAYFSGQTVSFMEGN